MSTPGFGIGGYGAGTYGNPPIQNLPPGYYLSLITSEYQQSTKYLAWLTAVMKPFGDIAQCLALMVTALDLDYAAGAQLDILGTIQAVSRTVPFQPSGGVSPVLTDSVYRLLIKASIAQNQWDGTTDGLQTQWQLLFPGGTIGVIDHQDMSATIVIPGSFASIVQDLIYNGLIVPRPEGVLYRYTFTSNPLFGFDQINSRIKGFDAGLWS